MYSMCNQIKNTIAKRLSRAGVTSACETYRIPLRVRVDLTRPFRTGIGGAHRNLRYELRHTYKYSV
jgi:hypothetical protein